MTWLRLRAGVRVGESAVHREERSANFITLTLAVYFYSPEGSRTVDQEWKKRAGWFTPADSSALLIGVFISRHLLHSPQAPCYCVQCLKCSNSQSLTPSVVATVVFRNAFLACVCLPPRCRPTRAGASQRLERWFSSGAPCSRPETSFGSCFRQSRPRGWTFSAAGTSYPRRTCSRSACPGETREPLACLRQATVEHSCRRVVTAYRIF